MSRQLASIRNIGIVAHIDAGKTTLTERMLFYTKSSHRLGDVDKGTTVTDFDPEEQERGITIYSAAVSFRWRDVTVNLIDTPGHVDFTAEVERSLRVLDGAVVVFSAREGVEAQSETVWRQADKYHVPRVALVNKLDREGADFFGTVNQIEKRLGAKPLVLHVPLGMGPPHVKDPFRGLVDLVEMQLLTYPPRDEVLEGDAPAEAFTVGPIPDEVADLASEWREQLISTLFDFSDELAELAMSEAPIPAAVIRKAVREATLARRVVPILAGSALDCIGVQPVLDAVAFYLPSPLDVLPVEGLDPSKKTPVTVKRAADPAAPFCGLVFKILAEKHGDLYFVRIYSGTLKAGSRMWNPLRQKKENIAQLWAVQADRREQIEKCEAGDIVGVIGPRNSITGDTLCDTDAPVILESIEFPETVISMAIEPETSLERKKLSEVLEMMKRQDPTFRASESEETGQTLISGMGELHLEVIRHRLQRDFNLKCRVHKPRVSYRERLTGEITVNIDFSKHLPSGVIGFGVSLRAQEIKDGTTGIIVGHHLPTEALPKPALQILLESIQKEAEGGGVYGNPMMGLSLTITSVSYREGESNEVAIRMAAADAFRKVLSDGKMAILEPIMSLEVVTPEEFLGNIQSDLNSRRAVIMNSNRRGDLHVLECEAPLVQMFGYSNQIRSLSQGRASYTMQPCRYEIAPSSAVDHMM